MKKVLIVFSILTLGISLLTGCIAPNGMAADDLTLAEEYMTNNRQLIEKYGADYTFKLEGGGGGGETNGAGKSGEMTYDFIVNDVDSYTVLLEKEKRRNWEVKGFLCTSCGYECEELKLSFSGKDVYAEGFLYLNGKEIEIIANFDPSYLRIQDAKLVRENEALQSEYGKDFYYSEDVDWDVMEELAEKEKASTLFFCDAEGNFDEFTATVQPEYQDYLGKDLTVLHFHAVE